jgi:RimJ/RimL family protein N-acetyltransferase
MQVLAPPVPPLSDGEVTLRPWNEDDVEALVSGLDGDEEISRWLELIPQPYRETEARMWIDGASMLWREGSGSPFAVLTVGGGVVGGAGINWIDREHSVGDVGYWLRRDARGHGYTTRAVRLLAEWAFSNGCERLQLRADVENVDSQRVAERVGFVREGVQRSARYNPRIGRRMDFVVFSLLPAELDVVRSATRRTVGSARAPRRA